MKPPSASASSAQDSSHNVAAKVFFGCVSNAPAELGMSDAAEELAEPALAVAFHWFQATASSRVMPTVNSLTLPLPLPLP